MNSERENFSGQLYVTCPFDVRLQRVQLHPQNPLSAGINNSLDLGTAIFLYANCYNPPVNLQNAKIAAHATHAAGAPRFPSHPIDPGPPLTRFSSECGGSSSFGDHRPAAQAADPSLNSPSRVRLASPVTAGQRSALTRQPLPLTPPTTISNRHLVRLECDVTSTKQTPEVLSNRH
jgi:hypothetical protein